MGNEATPMPGAFVTNGDKGPGQGRTVDRRDGGPEGYERTRVLEPCSSTLVPQQMLPQPMVTVKVCPFTLTVKVPSHEPFP